MKSFDAEAIFQISRVLEFLGNALSHYDDNEYREVVGRNKLGLESMRAELLKIDATLSIRLLDRMLTSLTDPMTYSRSWAIDRLGELSDRIKDELSLIQLIHLDSGREFFEPVLPLFGGEVAAKFPLISYDIAEAGKCLALERGTASVFHSIRTLEAGIRAIARCLGLPDPTKASDRTWGNVLRLIKFNIDSRWPPALMRNGGDGAFFESAYAALAGMQNPYRNSTMHLDQTYTTEDARLIFEIVKGFMRRLALRMDDSGDPKA